MSKLMDCILFDAIEAIPYMSGAGVVLNASIEAVAPRLKMYTAWLGGGVGSDDGFIFRVGVDI